MEDIVNQIRLEPAAEEEVLRANNVLQLLPYVKDWPSVKNETFVTVRHGVILNLWVMIVAMAAYVVQLVDPSLIDVRHYIQVACLMPLLSLWFIMRLDIVAKVLKTSFEPYYLTFNMIVFVVCQIIVSRASLAAILALLTFFLRAVSTIFGLTLAVIFIAYECALVVFSNELGLGYDFSGDNIFQLGDASLTVSGLLVSSGSAMVAFSLKNLVGLIRQPTHLLLINSSIAAIETKYAEQEEAVASV